MKFTTRLRWCWRAVRSVRRAQERQRRHKRRSSEVKIRRGERMRRKALAKLGGSCACCGLGMDFALCLEIHHSNGNGAEHRPVLIAAGIGLPQWVLVRDDPGEGLFALEVLCTICHRMRHGQGSCPHERRGKRAA